MASSYWNPVDCVGQDAKQVLMGQADPLYSSFHLGITSLGKNTISNIYCFRI